ncbi:MAG: nucleic acid-binding protein [Propionibacteriaceae bacterium]|jgi:predicted  nucleic acid-binding Zn-ribbon protein|nr:nucleic acid-binding protein [Propionibacteriaceae bacterium]
MKADPAVQRRLVETQRLDSAIAQLKHRAQTLPIHATIAQLTAERSQVADALVAARSRVGDAEEANRKAEADVVPVRERLNRDEKRRDDGALDHKALQGVMEEIESLKRRLSDLEDVELEAMESLEEAQGSLTAATERTGTVEEDLKAAVAERDAAVRELATEAKKDSQARQDVAAAIPADLLALYDKLRARYGGVGVAELEGRRCTGCGLEATTADYNAYIEAPADEVLRCAECDRILVRKEKV